MPFSLIEPPKYCILSLSMRKGKRNQLIESPRQGWPQIEEKDYSKEFIGRRKGMRKERKDPMMTF